MLVQMVADILQSLRCVSRLEDGPCNLLISVQLPKDQDEMYSGRFSSRSRKRHLQGKFGFIYRSFSATFSAPADTSLSAAKLEDTSVSLKNPTEARGVRGKMRLWLQNSQKWRLH